MPSSWPCRSEECGAPFALAARMQLACSCRREILHQVSWLLDRSLQRTVAVGVLTRLAFLSSITVARLPCPLVSDDD